jgi:stearoyl-CoA desaturase (delta-9 desaturase)
MPKPKFLWPQALLFAISLLVSVSLVPWYGLEYGYTGMLWLGFVVTLWLGGLSITAGYHRLWSHNSYQANILVRMVFALIGAGTLQNSIIEWASGHRRHHRFVDDEDNDPYSIKRGLWYAHIGWMLRDYDSGKSNHDNCPDLNRDGIVLAQHKYYGLLAITMNILPVWVIGALSGDMIGSILIIGFLRLTVSHHTTFLINSLAHYWGRQPYTSSNSAKDNSFLALLTYGEGYHNYHHRFQSDYRNGIRWYHIDPTKWLIWFLEKIRLARDLRRVPQVQINTARIERYLEVLGELSQGHTRGLRNKNLSRLSLVCFLSVERQRFNALLERIHLASNALIDEGGNNVDMDRGAAKKELALGEQAISQQVNRLRRAMFRPTRLDWWYNNA